MFLATLFALSFAIPAAFTKCTVLRAGGYQRMMRYSRLFYRNLRPSIPV